MTGRAETLIEVYVQPGAKKTEFSGLHDGRIKIRLQAPPVDGAANLALIKFVAQQLGCSASQVEVVKGLKSRLKTLSITGYTADDVLKTFKQG